MLPLMLIIALMILVSGRGGVFYVQSRVGRNNRNFRLIKFRTMRKGSEKVGLLTVGARDARITGTGYFLRKYKLDELPQLLNVLIGDMSLVGPRPEVRKYVDLYNEEQKKVLMIRPGITDYASLEYIDENEILADSPEPEKTYIEKIMPRKLELNLKYPEEKCLLTDLKIILKTIGKVFK